MNGGANTPPTGTGNDNAKATRWRLDVADLAALFAVLRRLGYAVIGPHLRDGVIAYDEIASPDELPIGWTDKQEPGKYRLEARTDAARFGFAVGPHSWKRELYPPRRRLWRAVKTADGGFSIDDTPEQAPRKLAFLGVRGCELAAIDILDRVMINGPYPDGDYAARRDHALIIALNCSTAGGTCFCVSMNTGPAITPDSAGRPRHDLALTEIIPPTIPAPDAASEAAPNAASEAEHYFVIEVGSERGAEIVRELPVREATDQQRQAAQAVPEETARHMGRQLDTTNIRDLLMGNLDHPRWDDVASRCLSCTNCTMVCPTCFCFQAEDSADLTGEIAEHSRHWDSCFSHAHSVMHGQPVRKTVRSRYRQWMTHKLATWIDQFGTSGCVGCGRCITWCPVGIDITEEARAIRDSTATTASADSTAVDREDDHANP